MRPPDSPRLKPSIHSHCESFAYSRTSGDDRIVLGTGPCVRRRRGDQGGDAIYLVGQDDADVIMVDFETEDITNLQLIIELAEKNRLPMIHPRGSGR
jgi:hypothetical protein